MSEQPITKPAVAKKDVSLVEFVPFGAQDKIKLSIAIVQNLVAVKTKTKQTCSERDALKFIAMCQAKRLNPFEGDAYLVGYDTNDGAQFSLITAHQAFLKRAEASPDYEGMESGVILIGENKAISEREGDFTIEGETVVGGWAKVYRKGRRPMYKRLSFAQRKPPYDSPFWRGIKAHEQIVKCAEADALRATFPTLLGGLYIREELDPPVIETSKPEFKQPLFGPASAPLEINGGALNEPEVDTRKQLATLDYVRHRIADLEIKEEVLMQYLHEHNVVDNELTTLHMVMEKAPEALESIQNHWGAVEPKLKAWIEEAK